MKVLFIDDESLIRRGFQAIIPWRKYGFDKCYEAEDGQEGIEKIKELNPELVLLDIRMQDIDGIEVTKHVREFGFKGRILIISGYSDFEYAKSAISYDVTAYLLKPVDITELITSIMKAKEELEKESLISVYAGQPINQSVTNVISDLITGRLKFTSDITLAYGIEFSNDYFRLIAIHPLTNNENSSISNDFLCSIKKRDTNMVMIKGEIYVLISSKTSFIEYEHLQKEYLLNVKPSELYFFQSNIIHNIHNLPAHYIGIENAIERLFYVAVDTYIYHYPRVQQQYNVLAFNILNQTQAIINTLLTLNFKQMEELISEYAYYLSFREVASDTIGIMLSNSYQQIITELFPHYPQMELEFPSHKTFLAKLFEFKFLYECIGFFKKQLTKMITFMSDDENHNPCKKLCQYIEANYAAPLRLESIAEQFGYNSSYLGKLFKKEVGESFNIYIDRIRIKYAKEYLKKNASVSQTAVSVGFSDIDYFTKKFRKYEDCSPSEYKKNNGGKNNEF